MALQKMYISRITVGSLLIAGLFVAGCAAPQKQPTAPPITESTIGEDLPPYPGLDTLPAREQEREKTAFIPSEIILPQDDFPPEKTLTEVQGPLPPMSYVNDRIFEYGRKLERWRAIDAQSAAADLTQEDTEMMVNCFVDLQKVLDGYNQLRADMLRLNTSSASLIIGADQVMDLQKSDISFLESICGKLLAPEQGELVDWEQREENADLPQLETLIERYTGSKEYEEVVQVWQKIPEQQVDRVHLRTKILYGNALMFLHQEEKAAEIYQQIVDEMSVSDEQRTDLLSLRKVLADLYTAAGNYSSAKKQYLNISTDYSDLGRIEEWSKLQIDILERSEAGGPELEKYSNLLRNFLGFIPERDGYKIVWEADAFLKDYPYSAVASNVDIIRSDANKRAIKWFDGFFTEVDELEEEKKYLDAIEKLEAIPGDIISVEQKEQIRSKNDELVLAEAVERETRKIERMQELEQRWNDGMLKVEEGSYDEAIAIFETLLQTEYYAKAEDKIRDITLLAAKTDRRAAADMYIRYTKTTDIEMKKKLLIESRRLLSEILVKYPGVDIVDKVKGNIDRVEQEMNLLDPTLLPRVKEAELEESIEKPNVEGDDDFIFAQPFEKQDATPPLEQNSLSQ